MTWRLSAVLSLVACTAPVSPVPDGGDAACTPGLTSGANLRLLTRAEYENTVSDLLGDTSRPARDFPREPLLRGLDNNASLNRVTADGVSQYLAAAEEVSARAVATRLELLASCPDGDVACGHRFIDGFGQRAFRRPLDAAEQELLRTVFGAGLSRAGFPAAVEWTLQAVLQSPQFLYRDEKPQGALTSVSGTLGPFGRATRLSYFLWATTPDDELLAVAAAGGLDTPEGLSAQARRMLADPRARRGLMRFFTLWLQLDEVEGVEKNTLVYPQATPELARAWRTSLELFVSDVLATDGTLPGLLRTNAFFTDATMGGMYGAPGPGPGEFVRTTMAGTQRTGLLAQPGFLALKAMPEGSSPVRRGIFVLDRLMCQPPPPPPTNVPIAPPDPSSSATTRERFAQHSTDPGCAGCHQFIDPVGFLFEHYDGLGAWRDSENGQPIDASGGITAARDPGLVGELASLADLQDRLAASPQVHGCVAGELYSFALGRQLDESDRCALATLEERFFASGGRFSELMLAIVESPAFVTAANPELVP